MNQEQLKNIVEAALMVSDSPLSITNLLSLFDKEIEQPEKNDIRVALTELQLDFAERGLKLKELASGFRFQVRKEYASWVNHLFEGKPQRYSRALLETLAIIAYRQPITRGEIENIRGVSVSSTIIKTIQEREWIRVVGHQDVPGKPKLLATTKQFLDYFNLKRLSDLPNLTEIKDFDQINPDLFEVIENEKKGSQGGNDPAADLIEENEGLHDEEVSKLAGIDDSDSVVTEQEEGDEVDAEDVSNSEEIETSDVEDVELDEDTKNKETKVDDEIGNSGEINEDDNVVSFSS